MYRPARKGEPENDQLLVKAEQNYMMAADVLLAQEDDERALEYAKLTLDYLRALYTDKAMEPGKAEEVVQRMIRLDPSEITYYFTLARIYEDAAVYDEAEYILQAARDARPTDPDVYITLAGFYNRMGDFDKTIEALEQRAEREPDNPEAFQTIAPYYWDNAQRNPMLSNEEKMQNVERGLEAVEKALSLRPEYIDAIVYKGLLLRTQALLETDPEVQQNLVKEAEGLSERAESLRKRRASGDASAEPAEMEAEPAPG
jgi:predicted Zn-dependent protease